MLSPPRHTLNNCRIGSPPNCLHKGLRAWTWCLRGTYAKIRGPYQDKSDRVEALLALHQLSPPDRLLFPCPGHLPCSVLLPTLVPRPTARPPPSLCSVPERIDAAGRDCGVYLTVRHEEEEAVGQNKPALF